MVHPKRLLELAHAFLEDVRRDMDRAAAEGADLPPRLRAVSVRPGQREPEMRTLAIPVPPGAGGASPEVLSAHIARYAADRPPTCLLLALDVMREDGGGAQQPLLIAEARAASGTRFFMMQPFRIAAGRVEWEEPLGGGWQDPGGEEMILDRAFSGR